MEVRWGGSSDVNRARSLAKELVALKPDVILSQGTPVTAAFKRETQTIPIVFVVVTDPVGDGFVAGLPHPGGNITGFLTSESGITAKMLEFQKVATQVEAQIGYKSVSWQEANADLLSTFATRDFIVLTVMGAMLLTSSFATS